MNQKIVDYIRQLFKSSEVIPLHVPTFIGNEKKYLNECIDSTFVSYVGSFVTKFEQMMADYTGAKYALAFVNGTLALHMAMILSGVKKDDEILAPALTFVATTNAIKYCGANPIFIDSELDTLGISFEKLEEFLTTETFQGDDGYTYNKTTLNRIIACVPVHIFGHPCRIDKIATLCNSKNIRLIEDAAESLGSFYKGTHTGLFGQIGIVSFNGNKTITTGGGGMLLTNDELIAQKARHLSTTAKLPHRWEFFHDEIGYNYRMPNINAAVGCAQMEKLPEFLENKRDLANRYQQFFANTEITFIKEPSDSVSNYWLNSLIFKNKDKRDSFLEYSNNAGIMTRPIWTLNSKLPMFSQCQSVNLENAQWLEERVVNIPSSIR